MKKISVFALLLALVIAIFLWLTSGKKPETQPTPVASENPVPPAAGNNSPAVNATPTNVPSAAPDMVSTDAAPQFQTKSMIHSTPPAPEPAAPVLSPEMVLDNMRAAIHNYHDTFGENPIGDNAEITAALSGKNPKQVNFLRDDAGLRKNDQGELLDAWGTPFFFHQVSGKVTEIRSAGQDKKMWTFDDLVTR